MEHIYHIGLYEPVNDELNQIISVETSVVKDLIGLKKNCLGLNNLTAQVIENSFAKKEKVFFKKDCKSIELMPYDLIIGAEVEDIKTLINSYLTEARYHVSHQQALVTGLMMFDFICINNELMNDGYFITSKNREEKYIEILETGDEELVDKLEKYLNASDTILRASFLQNEYNRFYIQLKQQSDIEKVKEIGNEFLERLKNVGC